jgi:hypothetical protein
MQFSIMNTQGNLASWVDVGSSQANTINILRDVQWPDGTYGVVFFFFFFFNVNKIFQIINRI